MRYPSNFGQNGGFTGFSPAPPVDMSYLPQMPMPVSVSYQYEDGSWSGPQMIQNNFPIPIDNNYSTFSFNPDASEFIPSYWKPVEEQPFNGTMMNGGGGGGIYEESYPYHQDYMPYGQSSSGATPAPLFEVGQDLPNYFVNTMPPSGQDANGNSQTYPKAPSDIVHQMQNATLSVQKTAGSSQTYPKAPSSTVHQVNNITPTVQDTTGNSQTYPKAPSSTIHPMQNTPPLGQDTTGNPPVYPEAPSNSVQVPNAKSLGQDNTGNPPAYPKISSNSVQVQNATPSGQDATGNSRTYANAASGIGLLTPNAVATSTIEVTEKCKNPCCNRKEPLVTNGEATAAAQETTKKVTADDAKKDTERIEVIPIQVAPVTCFPLYGFIGLHYGLPDPPLPETQNLLRVTSSKDNQSRLIIHSGPSPQTTPKSTPKEQASASVPKFSAMPLPLLPVPQISALVPNNYQPLSKTLPKKVSNPELYTCVPQGFVRVAPKNFHYLNPAKLPQENGK